MNGGPAAPPPDRRDRRWLLAWAVGLVAVGLGSRAARAELPAWVGAYVGDALWATCAYLALAWCRPGAAASRLFAGAVGVAFAVELSQLWRAEWLEAMRATRVGALLLGRGFVWSDLPCYVAGAGLGVVVDARGVRRRGGVRAAD